MIEKLAVIFVAIGIIFLYFFQEDYELIEVPSQKKTPRKINDLSDSGSWIAYYFSDDLSSYADYLAYLF